MCIVCRFGQNDPTPALAFLDKWEASRREMRSAANAMLLVSKSTPDATDRKRYDRMHKAMVRAIRDWNRLEETSEADLDKEDKA